jgi:chromosome segregation ATPase
MKRKNLTEKEIKEKMKKQHKDLNQLLKNSNQRLKQMKVSAKKTSTLHNVDKWKKVDKIEKNVENLTQKVDKIEKNVENLTQKVDTIENNVEKLTQQVGKIEKNVNTLNQSNDKMALAITNLQTDMAEVKETMVTKEDMQKIHITMDSILKIVKKTEEEGTFMSYRLQEHEKDIKALKKVTHLD